jgi:DNA-binding IclR family transcriptional regulator
MDMAGSYGPSRLTGATESGLGLALLAEQPEGEVERVYWDRPIPGFAGGWTALRASLWEAKSQGFAYRRAERAGERPSLGMPLKDGMSGLGLSGAIGEKEVGDLLFQLRRAVELLARDQL